MTIDLKRPDRFTDLDRAVEWVWDQLRVLELGFNQARDFITLKELHVEPSRRYTGLTVLADGTDWNPGGTGAGVYTYYGGAWHKLG